MLQGEPGAKNAKDTSKVYVSSAHEVLPVPCVIAGLWRCCLKKNNPLEAIPVAVSAKSQGFPEKMVLIVACPSTARGDSSFKI